MTRLQSTLSLFALPADDQAALLPALPADRGAPHYYADLTRNPLRVLLAGLPGDAFPYEQEPAADYRARTGLNADVPGPALQEMCCLATLILHHYLADEFWNRQALQAHVEWQLCRRLAGLALAEAGWVPSCREADLTAAIAALCREAREG